MLLKCYHHLHPMIDCEVAFANAKSDEKCSLNIFEMTTSTNELVKKLVNRKLQIFKRFQMYLKETKCHFQWW